MFDFIRKPELWQAWDEGLDKEIQTRHFAMKAIQDLVVYRLLRGTTGKRIAEVGAGNSRVLPTLAKENTCVAIEKFEGQGGGPKESRLGKSIATIPAYLGTGDPQLPFGTFDIVYSISVVEHVPFDTLEPFHREQLALLKPGGMFLHAIDLYLEDEPSDAVVRRFERYRGWVCATEGVTPLGAVYDGPCRFTTDIATNPDDNMYRWGQVAPGPAELRKRAQSVSLLLGGRTAASA